MSKTQEPINCVKKLGVPRPSSGFLESLGEADRPVAVLSDFDGTIFLQDTGHILFDKFGCGKERREVIDKSIGKTKTFREASEELWESLHVTLKQAKEELRNHLVIDPDFIHFFDYLQEHNVSFTVVSAGMEPLLRAALDEFVGPERSKKIRIIANDGTITEDGRWKIKWHHDSPLGIDKSLAFKEWLSEWDTSKAPKPRIIFTGDGVSDLPAASHADILFARRGLALEDYCIKHMIPYIPYMRFKEALHDIKLLLKGNRFHDPKAAEMFKHFRLLQMNGLGPLSSSTNSSTSDTISNDTKTTRALFGFTDYEEDEDDEDIRFMTADDSVELSVAERPQTPPKDPLRPKKPLLNRNFSVGEVPTL